MPRLTAPTRMWSIRSRVLRGTASNVVGKCINLGVWFVVTPVLVHRLGLGQYGLWALVGTIIVYGALFDFGIGAAVSKYVAEYRFTRRYRPRPRGSLSTALWLYAVIGVLAAVLASISLRSFLFFQRPPSMPIDCIVALRPRGLTIAVELPTSTAFAVLRGLQCYERSTSSAASRCSCSATHDRVVMLGGGVVAVAAVNAPLALVMQVPMIRAIRRAQPDLRYGWGRPSREGW